MAAKKKTNKTAEKSTAPAKKKTAVKSSSSKTASKKATPKKSPSTKAVKKTSAPKKSAVKKTSAKSSKTTSASTGSSKPTQVVDPNNPLGKKFTCYSCGTKFYDLNKVDKLCPKCGADQMAKPALKSRQAALRASDYDYDEDDNIRKQPEEDDDEEDGFVEESSDSDSEDPKVVSTEDE